MSVSGSLPLGGAALGGAAFPSFLGVALLSPLGWCALSSLLLCGAVLPLILVLVVVLSPYSLLVGGAAVSLPPKTVLPFLLKKI